MGLVPTVLGSSSSGAVLQPPRLEVNAFPDTHLVTAGTRGPRQDRASCSPLVGATMGQHGQGWRTGLEADWQGPGACTRCGLTPSLSLSLCPLPTFQVSFIRLRIFTARRSTEICTDLLVGGEWNSPHHPIS